MGRIDFTPIPRVALIVLLLAPAGCVTWFGGVCDEVDQELGEILVSYVPVGTMARCARNGDCVMATPIAKDSPRSEHCRQPVNREAAFGFDRFRADGRVIALMAKAKPESCPVTQPVCQAIEYAGCV